MMLQKAFTINVEGMSVFLLCEAPSWERRNPTVIFFHGFTGHHIETGRIFASMAHRLLKEGFATVRFDYRFHGDSEGDFEDFTLSSAIKDALTVYDTVVSWNWVDPGKIGCIGFSLGTAVAVEVAEAKPFKAIVLWAVLGESWLRNLRKRIKSMEKGLIPLYGAFQIKREGFIDIMSHRFTEKIDKINSPTLIVHCKDDRSVNPKNAVEFYSRLRCVKKLFWIKSGGHGFATPETREILFEETIKWFKTFLA
ncbi:MAG: alpha/beta fold hydrolase [Thermoproteales archaeon]|nr:alpha/beta fold hydrolase [Thermoproteales archaeon]